MEDLLTFGSITQNLDERGVNVKGDPFDAVGDGVHDDSLAIQAAIDSLTDGGVVFFPAGSYLVDTSLTLPLGTMITLQGAGTGSSGPVYGTQLRRTGTSPIFNFVGTSQSSVSGRVLCSVRDMEISGQSTAGTIINIERASKFQWSRVRVARSTQKGVIIKEMYDSEFHGCVFESMGSGTTHPAVTFDSEVGEGTPSQGASATVHMSNCIWQANNGTDLKLAGSAADVSPTNEVQLANCKMEAGVGSHPYIDLSYAQNCAFSNLKISVPTGRSGPYIIQDTTGSGGRPNKFNNTTIDNAGSTVPTYYVDHGVGDMQFTGISALGTAPSIAYFRIRSTVATNRFTIKGATPMTTAVPRILDERAINEWIGKGIARVARQGGSSTVALVGTTVITSLPDGSTTDAYGVLDVPNDCLVGSAILFRILWTANATTGDVRWRVASQNSFSAGEGIAGAATNYDATATMAGTARLLVETTVATGPTANPGDVLQVYLQRIGADAADTLTVAAEVAAVEVLYDRVI